MDWHAWWNSWTGATADLQRLSQLQGDLDTLHGQSKEHVRRGRDGASAHWPQRH